MYSMAKLCSKSVSTLNLTLYTLFRHEASVHSFCFSVCILRPIRPVTMNRTAHNTVAQNMFYPYLCTDSSSLVIVFP